MLKLFKIWLALTIISLGIYTPLYLFSNNPIDAVEELTMWAYTPATNAANLRHDYSDIRDRMTRMGVDIDMELEDAVDENPLLSNLDVSYVAGDFANYLRRAKGQRLVKATIDVDGGYQLSFVFVVSNKMFLKGYMSMVLGIAEFVVSRDEFQVDLAGRQDAELLFMMLFHGEEEARTEAVQEMLARYNAHSHEDVAGNQRTAQPQASTPKTLGEAMETLGMSTDPIISSPNANRSEKVLGQSLEEAISTLVASVAAETGASEYADAREVLETQIVGSEATDVAVLYTMEGNIATRYLAVLEQTNSGFQVAGNTTIELGAYELSADNGIISVKTLTHALEDPMCCPTLETVYRYRPEGGQLVMIQ